MQGWEEEREKAGMRFVILIIWAIIVAAGAIGTALDWNWGKKHFTPQDDERLEPPR